MDGCTLLVREMLGTDQNANDVKDDSFLNCMHAQQYGWTTVHLLEDPIDGEQPMASKYRVNSLLELRKVFPEFFKSTAPSAS